MGKKLNNSPLFYTLSQILFNTIQKMDSYEPDIQEKFRKNYPEFKVDNLKTLNIRKINNESPIIEENNPSKRWRYTNLERNEGYLLQNNSIIFQTTNYDSFDMFLDQIIKGLNIIHESVGLAYIERVGLRYLNVILPDNEKKIDDYIMPFLLGFPIIKNGNIIQTYSETIAQINEGNIAIRVVKNKNVIPLPPDLHPFLLQPSNKFMTPFQTDCVSLDIDYAVSKRINYDIEKIKNQLILSHDIVEDMFKSSVTEDALKIWG